MKYCPCCSETKPLAEFTRSTSGKCRPCDSAYMRKYREGNPRYRRQSYLANRRQVTWQMEKDLQERGFYTL